MLRALVPGSASELSQCRQTDAGTRTGDAPYCVFRWVQVYAPELNRRCRPYLRPTTKSYRFDETYIKVNGRWKYLYRAVDSSGQTIDFLLVAKRDAAGAKRFFRNIFRLRATPHRE